ncbi:hypothetical protein, partial [Humibacter sp.]|uniref:hypothetical protein n=1 Tax=Humibacter sp. TaxID=1940291 RepID=UPI003F7FEB22
MLGDVGCVVQAGGIRRHHRRSDQTVTAPAQLHALDARDSVRVLEHVLDAFEQVRVDGIHQSCADRLHRAPEQRQDRDRDEQTDDRVG